MRNEAFYRVDLLDIVKKHDGSPSDDPKDYAISSVIPCGMNPIVWFSVDKPGDLSGNLRPYKALVFSKWKGQPLSGSYEPYQVLLYNPSLGTGDTVVTDSELSDGSVVIKSTVCESKILGSAYVEESSILRSTALGRASVKNSTLEVAWLGDDVAVLRATINDSTLRQSAAINNSTVKNSVIGDTASIENSSLTRCTISGPVRVSDSELKGCSIGGTALIHKSNISNVSLCATENIIDANISGPEDLLLVGPAPSSNRYTSAYRDHYGLIRISCGCFNGNIEEFVNAIYKTHAKNEFYLTTYLLYVDLINKYFKLAS